ncbi:MAG: O-antigen ligase family protein [Syntrophales bacterium]
MTDLRRDTDGSGIMGFRMVLVLWFLYLFEPARLLAYFAPSLNPLKWIPTVLLYLGLLIWLHSPMKKYNYGFYIAFLAVTLMGTVIAFFDGNWGIARALNRQIFQFLILGLMTFTFVNNANRIRTLFHLYFLHIMFFAVWGLFGLILSPIDPSSDPGLRKIVAWHPWFDNRDAFGPLMIIGTVFALYYFKMYPGSILKMLFLSSAFVCLAGIILSFGRGVFLAMIGTFAFVWYQSRKKVTGLIVAAAAAVVIVGMTSVISPAGMYWDKMKTIESGVSSGTGADRFRLWRWALIEFMESPILGVGTGNYGIKLISLIPQEEITASEYTLGSLWGRSIHCAPLTILCEYGLIGFAVFSFLFLDFIRTNRQSKTDVNEAETLQMWPSVLQASFAAFWMNALFYEIIYAPFFWNILILNRMVYLHRTRLNPGRRNSASTPVLSAAHETAKG